MLVCSFSMCVLSTIRTSIKSVVEISDVFLNKPQGRRFIYMATMALVQPKLLQANRSKRFVTGLVKYTMVTIDLRRCVYILLSHCLLFPSAYMICACHRQPCNHANKQQTAWFVYKNKQNFKYRLIANSYRQFCCTAQTCQTEMYAHCQKSSVSMVVFLKRNWCT